ncbi:hypothetical protein L2E82_27621 [Cichorium intybus]|uniref:Uncharacterized protein n=1 Tax=Cichorium intybus TaxID=13427 RepID=A0ACB9CTW9_CICIN|nr:hypothetical protein L2E82_27621 [Cichorium intybus]
MGPLVVVVVIIRLANADIYVEIDKFPKEGETIYAKTGQTLAGGKGANQAICGAMLSYPTYFVGQIRKDAHGKLILEALEGRWGSHQSFERFPTQVLPEFYLIVKSDSSGLTATPKLSSISGAKTKTSSIDASIQTSSSREADRSGELSISNVSDVENEWVEQDEPVVYYQSSSRWLEGTQTCQIQSREIWGDMWRWGGGGGGEDSSEEELSPETDFNDFRVLIYLRKCNDESYAELQSCRSV